MWLVGFLGIMLYWGCNYTDNHGGTFSALVYEPYLSTNQLAEFRPKGEGDILMARGRSVYKTICAPCHMESGTGDPTRFIPPLAESDWVTAEGPNRLIRIVLHGLTGPITVNGKTWSGTAMLAWRDTLSDEDIAAVLTYTRNAWGNRASPVSAEKVQEVRAATADRSDNWTEEELLRIPVED